MKKILSLIMILAMILSTTTMTFAATDEPSSWAKVAVQEMIADGVVPVALQSQYQKPITRAEFASLVVNVVENKIGKTLASTANSFTDTNDTYVNKAYKAGIVNGVGNGKYDPSGLITREQIAIMFVNTLASLDTLETGKEHIVYATTNPNFTDESNISSWAKASAHLAFNNSIISGVGNGKLDPKGSATREQAIIIAYRVSANLKDESFIPLLKATHAGKIQVDRETANQIILGLEVTKYDVMQLFKVSRDKAPTELKSTVTESNISLIGTEYDTYGDVGIHVHFKKSGEVVAVSLQVKALSGNYKVGDLKSNYTTTSVKELGTGETVTDGTYTTYVMVKSGYTYEFVWDAKGYLGVTIYLGDVKAAVVKAAKE